MSILSHIEQAYQTIVADLDHDARDMLDQALSEAKADEAKLKEDVHSALGAVQQDADAAVQKYGPEVGSLVQKLVQSVEGALASHV